MFIFTSILKFLGNKCTSKCKWTKKSQNGHNIQITCHNKLNNENLVLSNLKKGYSKYMITDVPFIQTKTKLHALKNCFYATPTIIV